MRVEELTEVCRLCLKNENLVSIFEQLEYKDNLKDVIFIMTGVQVAPTDHITKKICRKCMHIVIKMKQFRKDSLESDTVLKEKYKELMKSHNRMERKPIVIHPTVKEVFTKYQNIKLPMNCLKMDIAPCVELTMNEVECYFEQRSRDMEDFMDALKLLPPKDDENMVTKTAVEEQLQTTNVIRKESSVNPQKEEKLFKYSPISPISIKLTNPDKTEYTIVRNSDESKTHTMKLNGVKRKIASRDSSPNLTSASTSKKRRISSSSSDSDKKENTKPNLIESLGLTPTKTIIKAVKQDPIQVSLTERSLQICNICSSVHYHLKDLKRHQLKHLRCQFCKSRCKSMALKEEHIKNSCIIKKTMNSFPDVDIEKIEYDLDVRMKYPDAFVGFPLIPGLVLQSKHDKLNPHTNNKCSTTDTNVSEIENTDDFIEILSDDEEPVPSTSAEKTKKQSDGLTDLATTTFETQSGVNASSTNSTEQQQFVNYIDVTNQPSSVIKPDIKIKDSEILEALDPKATDLMVLKELLKNYKKLKLLKDAGTQSELPSNTSIETKPDVFAATLKDLRSQLHIYRIPVTIRNGPVFQVSFNYTPLHEKPKEMCEWSNLTPINLRPARLDTDSRSNKTPITQTPVSSQTVQNQDNKGPNFTPNKPLFNPNVNDTIIITTSSKQQPVNSIPGDGTVNSNIVINSAPINNIEFSQSNSISPSQNAIVLNSAFRNQIDYYNVSQTIPTVNTSSNNVGPSNYTTVPPVQPAVVSAPIIQNQHNFVFNKPQQIPDSTRFTLIAPRPSINTTPNQVTNSVLKTPPLSSQNAVSFRFPVTASMNSLSNTTPVVSYPSDGTLRQPSKLTTPMQQIYRVNTLSTALINPQNNYRQCNSNNAYSNVAISAITSNNISQFLNSTTSPPNQIIQSDCPELIPLNPNNRLLTKALISTTTHNPSINSKSTSVDTSVKSSPSALRQYRSSHVNYVFNEPTNLSLNKNVSDQNPSKPTIRVRKFNDLI